MALSYLVLFKIVVLLETSSSTLQKVSVFYAGVSKFSEG